MPHKHKRDKSKADPSFYDLPPSKTAQPLPTRKPTTTNGENLPISPKRKRTSTQDDTPRAFTRLLTGYRPPRSGLDDGTRPSKKRKASKQGVEDATAPPPVALTIPTIQPHEPLSSFAARVDAALPFSGLTKKGGGGKGSGRERQTKTEKKMQKMYKEWREEDKRRKEKLEDELDENVDEEEMEELKATIKGRRKGRKKKRGGGENGEEVDDEDPWAHIKAKSLSDGGSSGGLLGLHDVVLAPPKFSKVPKGKENFNIGKGEGGLKRQAELTEARRSIVDGYRQMMSEKRSANG